MDDETSMVCCSSNNHTAAARQPPWIHKLTLDEVQSLLGKPLTLEDLLTTVISADESHNHNLDDDGGGEGEVIERRQKRMIKNRESAARSRARKQAYTNQLEHQVLRLRKTNNWLRKNKETERFLVSTPPSEPRYQLRRTTSATF